MNRLQRSLQRGSVTAAILAGAVIVSAIALVPVSNLFNQQEPGSQDTRSQAYTDPATGESCGWCAGADQCFAATGHGPEADSTAACGGGACCAGYSSGNSGGNNGGGQTPAVRTCSNSYPTASACLGVAVNDSCNGFPGTCVENGSDANGILCGCRSNLSCESVGGVCYNGFGTCGAAPNSPGVVNGGAGCSGGVCCAPQEQVNVEVCCNVNNGGYEYRNRDTCLNIGSVVAAGYCDVGPCNAPNSCQSQSSCPESVSGYCESGGDVCCKPETQIGGSVPTPIPTPKSTPKATPAFTPKPTPAPTPKPPLNCGDKLHGSFWEDGLCEYTCDNGEALEVICEEEEEEEAISTTTLTSCSQPCFDDQCVCPEGCNEELVDSYASTCGGNATITNPILDSCSQVCKSQTGECGCPGKCFENGPVENGQTCGGVPIVEGPQDDEDETNDEVTPKQDSQIDLSELPYCPTEFGQSGFFQEYPDDDFCIANLATSCAGDQTLCRMQDLTFCCDSASVVTEEEVYVTEVCAERLPQVSECSENQGLCQSRCEYDTQCQYIPAGENIEADCVPPFSVLSWCDWIDGVNQPVPDECTTNPFDGYESCLDLNQNQIYYCPLQEASEIENQDDEITPKAPTLSEDIVDIDDVQPGTEDEWDVINECNRRIDVKQCSEPGYEDSCRTQCETDRPCTFLLNDPDPSAEFIAACIPTLGEFSEFPFCPATIGMVAEERCGTEPDVDLYPCQLASDESTVYYCESGVDTDDENTPKVTIEEVNNDQVVGAEGSLDQESDQDSDLFELTSCTQRCTQGDLCECPKSCVEDFAGNGDSCGGNDPNYNATDPVRGLPNGMDCERDNQCRSNRCESAYLCPLVFASNIFSPQRSVCVGENTFCISDQPEEIESPETEEESELETTPVSNDVTLNQIDSCQNRYLYATAEECNLDPECSFFFQENGTNGLCLESNLQQCPTENGELYSWCSTTGLNYNGGCQYNNTLYFCQNSTSWRDPCYFFGGDRLACENAINQSCVFLSDSLSGQCVSQDMPLCSPDLDVQCFNTYIEGLEPCRGGGNYGEEGFIYYCPLDDTRQFPNGSFCINDANCLSLNCDDELDVCVPYGEEPSDQEIVDEVYRGCLQLSNQQNACNADENCFYNWSVGSCLPITQNDQTETYFPPCPVDPTTYNFYPEECSLFPQDGYIACTQYGSPGSPLYCPTGQNFEEVPLCSWYNNDRFRCDRLGHCSFDELSDRCLYISETSELQCRCEVVNDEGIGQVFGRFESTTINGQCAQCDCLGGDPSQNVWLACGDSVETPDNSNVFTRVSYSIGTSLTNTTRNVFEFFGRLFGI